MPSAVIEPEAGAVVAASGRRSKVPGSGRGRAGELASLAEELEVCISLAALLAGEKLGGPTGPGRLIRRLRAGRRGGARARLGATGGRP
jgi:hypothetical protein